MTVDKQDFDELAEIVRRTASVFLREYFGERCPDFSHGCECCRRWQLLDKLLEDPYLRKVNNV